MSMWSDVILFAIGFFTVVGGVFLTCLETAGAERLDERIDRLARRS